MSLTHCMHHKVSPQQSAKISRKVDDLGLLRLLIIEDSEDDALLMIDELKQRGLTFSWKRVDKPDQIQAALKEDVWDIVLADHYTPHCIKGLTALVAVQSTEKDIPLVIVSGKLEEEAAIVLMKAGACDYVMKDNLSRLAPVVEREVREARSRAETKRQKHTAEQNEKTYRETTENANDAIILRDCDGKVVSWNPAAERLFQYTEAESIGRSFRELLVRLEDYELYDAHFEQLRQTGSSQLTMGMQNILARRKDGTEIPVEVSISPIVNDGQMHILNIARDVSERTQFEAQREVLLELLSKRELRWRMLIENMTDFVLELDPALTVTYVSPAIEPILGYTPNEIVGNKATDFLHPEDRFIADAMLHAFSDPSSIKTMAGRARTKSGDWRWVESKGSLVKTGPDKDSLICVVRDVTERHLAIERFKAMFEGTLNALADAAELRDPYTAGHQRRVAHLAAAIAQELGLSNEMVRTIQLASLVHDIGKLTVPADILTKPSKLSAIEFELIKCHSQAGYDILKKIDFPWPIAETVYQHHERLDGSGYPRGLKAAQILIESQVLAVADVVEAMASHRPYRPALGIDVALQEIEANSGKLYYEPAVKACIKLFRDKAFMFQDKAFNLTA